MFTGVFVSLVMMNQFPMPMASGNSDSMAFYGPLRLEDNNYYQFLAMSLIQSDPEVLISTIIKDKNIDKSILMDFAKRNAIRMELLCQKETYIFSDDLHLYVDLREIRDRYWALLDTPNSSYFCLIPDKGYLSKEMSFSREFQSEIRRRMVLETDKVPAFINVLTDCVQRYMAYDYLMDAKHEWRTMYSRRVALANYIGMVGEDAFYNREIPEIIDKNLFYDQP